MDEYIIHKGITLYKYRKFCILKVLGVKFIVLIIRIPMQHINISYSVNEYSHFSDSCLIIVSPADILY